MDIEKKCVAALAHRAHPKQFVERLTDDEKEDLAAIWDEHGETLGEPFAAAFSEFWTAHTTRWQEYLASLKATDETTDEPAE